MKSAALLMAVASMAAAPVAAAPANPAGSLSVASTARAGSPSAHDSRLAGGGGIVAIIGVVLIAVTVAVVASNKDTPRSP